MPPTTLLADPTVRLAGVRRRVRAPRGRGTAVKASRSRLSRGWLGLVAVFVIAAGGLGFLGTWPPLATVMSASMEPTIKTGDVVVLKKLDRAPRVGDIVAISVPPDIRTRFGYPPVVIHRIVEIDRDGVVTTKGDAYKEKDPFDVPTSALTTKVVATVPAAGRLLGFLSSGLGLLWLGGGALMFVGMPLLERYRDAQRREEAKGAGLHAALQALSQELALLRDEPPTREGDATEVVAELRLLVANTAARESAMVTELGTLLTQRDAVAEEERRAERAALAEALRAERAAAAEELRAANARAAETLQAMTVSFTESLEAANRRAEAAEAQLHAHLAQLPAQIERAVALALANHTPAPPPPAPPAPGRSGRFIAASDWARTAAWDAPAPVAT